jgi:hypothetical protein
MVYLASIAGALLPDSFSSLDGCGRVGGEISLRLIGLVDTAVARE